MPFNLSASKGWPNVPAFASVARASTSSARTGFSAMDRPIDRQISASSASLPISAGGMSSIPLASPPRSTGASAASR